MELRDGMEIAILASKSFGDETWVRYEIHDLGSPDFAPRKRGDSWLFHARVIKYRDTHWWSPMRVEESRIRIVE